MSLEVKAVVSSNHSITEIAGDEERYFRVDDKKSYEKVKPDSKYFLVSISAGKVIVLTVGNKDKKYSITSTEYEKDDKWAEAIRRLFSEKLVKEIAKSAFYSEYKRYIVEPLLEEELTDEA